MTACKLAAAEIVNSVVDDISAVELSDCIADEVLHPASNIDDRRQRLKMLIVLLSFMVFSQTNLVYNAFSPKISED